MITYENHGNYYTFSDQPNARIYLGEADPEDYLHDITEQAKRSASCHYYEIATDKKVSQEEAFDKSHAKDELIWHDAQHGFDKIENYTYGYRCTYDYNRRVSVGSMGGSRKNCTYNSKDPAMVRLANAYFFDQTLEQYDAQQEEYRIEREEREKKSPSITNLMMVGGEPPYYVDYEDNRITTEEHTTLMKKTYGDDVFEKEAERLDRETSPEVKKIVAEIMKRKEL